MPIEPTGGGLWHVPLCVSLGAARPASSSGCRGWLRQVLSLCPRDKLAGVPSAPWGWEDGASSDTALLTFLPS